MVIKNTNYIEELLTKFTCREDCIGLATTMSTKVSSKDDLLKNLEKHLSGDLRLGLYNLLPDGNVKWAVVEFENHGDAAAEDTWLVDALKYQRYLSSKDIPSILERSKNPNGQCYHLHIGFEQPLPARIVREGLHGIGKELFGTFGNEIFPKSDEGLGHFVWLPLFGGKDKWGHGTKEGRAVFIDADGHPFSDQIVTVANWQLADSQRFLNTVKPLLPIPTFMRPSKNATGIEVNQPGLEKMEARCSIVARWVKDPIGWRYDHWLGLGSNYVVFKGGWERFIELSKQDTTNFSQSEINRIHDEVLGFYGPQTYEKFKDQGLEFELPVPGPKAPAGWGKIGTGQSGEFVHLNWNDDLMVQVDGSWVVTPLEELKTVLLPVHTKLTAVCPACCSNDAVVKLDTFHFVNIWCDKCQKASYEHPVSPGLFAFKGELFRVEMRSNKFISPEPLKKEHFRTPKDFDYAKRLVFNDPLRSFSSDDFQMRRIGSAESEKLGYEFETSDNAIILRYPPLAVKVQDNAYINRFVEGMFGQYADFIKDWMAMYTYTNYVRLPVIVLAGDRYAGKNTFAEMVGKIFPKLMGLWDGDVKAFNPQFTNKLLFVDENRNAHKPEQYAELKRITGNERLPINKKYENEFNAPNNLNIIISTNDAKPIYLKWGEEPRDEKVNNFFIHYCYAIPEDHVDHGLKQKLEDRLGYYVRTELKQRFEHLSKNLDSRNRYYIAAPITEYAAELYASSMTSIEMEAQELAEAIVLGCHEVVSNRSGYTVREIWYEPTDWNGEYYVRQKSIRELIRFLDLRSGSTIRAYTDALYRMKVISAHSDYRNNKQQLGYKILRNKDYYRTCPQPHQHLAQGEEGDKLPF
jgi:hypothetical protein